MTVFWAQAQSFADGVLIRQIRSHLEHRISICSEHKLMTNKCGFYMQTHTSFWDLHSHKTSSQILLAAESSAMQHVQYERAREKKGERERGYNSSCISASVGAH